MEIKKQYVAKRTICR